MRDSNNTLQQLERTEGSVKRDEKWEAAFLAQLTHDLGEKVMAFAKKRALYIQLKRGADDHNLVRELYQDAIADTWTGDVSWDPLRSSLELHLKRVIRSRTSHQLKHLDRFPHFSMDRPSNQAHAEMSDEAPDAVSEEPADAMPMEFEHSLSESIETDRRGNRGDLATFVDELVEALILLAGGDEEVLQILYCFGRGITERRDVIHETQMSSSTYHNARRRMLRLVERLPQHIRDAAIAAMD